MKKQKKQKNAKNGASEPDFKAGNQGTEERSEMSILDLAASFWDAERGYPTERRA